ncbi:MAG TPA: ATP-binding cassette domain-containing protein [Ornithinimicrobium sp.]|uniref:ABC transporter ATP-binding protein n=1 Tax=Ornithinimicrobium sp. TaxID=1977084 RepID=UPI002B49BE7C|nr:ATP-binding cassette domain-containing protein [Ornithinimicrobium sp.]HKJ11710.1 ATP-binding cassette domain-containing protein [Ornithinimicrobium sp.]
MIRLEGVTKRFADGTVAVDDLSVEAPEGKITVLVGPSGCGKTTSLRMINRMIEPTSGRILINGEDALAKKPAQLRRSIGYVIQHAGLFPHRTVLANVTTVPTLLKWDKAKARERGMEVLELVGLGGDFAKRYPGQLSGGQQQRVGVARALAGDPEVMLMDEPFSAVDPVVREGLQDEFLKLQESLGTTIVMVTHDIDEAIKLGDRIAVLREGGQLAQFSSPDDLLAHPADDFVASFVGRDRGYRALSFQHAEVPVHDEEVVRLGERLDSSGGSEGPWRLVVDEESRPQGWVHDSEVHGEVTAQDLQLGGTLAERDGSLRGLLDAALSSPSGRGVVTHEGRLVGTVDPTEVLQVIQAVERPRGDSIRTHDDDLDADQTGRPALRGEGSRAEPEPQAGAESASDESAG